MNRDHAIFSEDASRLIEASFRYWLQPTMALLLYISAHTVASIGVLALPAGKLSNSTQICLSPMCYEANRLLE